ncbi:DUF2971 domain-containing protein [Enterocloster clostridioformis]|nr:DUF2971 domain-containing protein [Enterocloster clostridioformis]MCF2705204.1 DUF2971 domain-containing protein [Enterocloster clostridioformis]
MEENKYLVYHYCDLYAFLNIMRTKTLWLSDVKKSNDEDEGKYLLKKLHAYIDVQGIMDSSIDRRWIQKAKQLVMDYMGKSDQRMFVPKNYNYDELVEMRKNSESTDVVVDKLERVELTEEQLKNEEKRWEIVEQEAEEFGNGLVPGDEYETDKFDVPLYTICFSGNSDLLSQWRGYAKDGTGIAIGFKTKYLKKWKSAIFDKKAIMTAKFDQVNYKNLDMEYLLQLKSRSLIEYAKKLIEETNEEMKGLLESAIEEELEEIAENSIFYKSELFQEEDEYWLIYRDLIKCQNSQYIKNSKGRAEIEKRIRDFKLSEAKYRVGAEGIISYFDLSFEPVMNNIIGEIVLGPKCKMTTADVEFLLSSWGYNCVGENVYDQRSIYIHHSELSYR